MREFARRYWVLGAVFIGMCALVAGLRAPVTRWLDIDACLDRGGSWNYAVDVCEYAPVAPRPVEDPNEKAVRRLRAGDYWTGQEFQQPGAPPRMR